MRAGQEHQHVGGQHQRHRLVERGQVPDRDGDQRQRGDDAGHRAGDEVGALDEAGQESAVAHREPGERERQHVWSARRPRRPTPTVWTDRRARCRRSVHTCAAADPQPPQRASTRARRGPARPARPRPPSAGNRHGAQAMSASRRVARPSRSWRTGRCRGRPPRRPGAPGTAAPARRPACCPPRR